MLPMKTVGESLVALYYHMFRETQILSVKFEIFSYRSILTYVLGAQKNRLIETVLLSTHKVCFG